MSANARTNIVIDQELMCEALELSGLSSRRELVNYALQELVRREKQKQILLLKGKVAWVGNLDDMRETRWMDIMVDTSVWVDFFNNVENQQVLYLERMLQQGRVGTCPIIMMEVLQGIRSDRICKKTESTLSVLANYPITDQPKFSSWKPNGCCSPRTVRG